MKTFDSAGELEKQDGKAFEISNGIRDLEAARATTTPAKIEAPTFNDGAFNAQLDNAYRTHVESKLPPPEVVDPTLRETMKAAFLSGNTIGSLMSSQSFAENLVPTKNSPELTDHQIFDRVAKEGLNDFIDRFVGVTNEAQFEARANDINREQENLRIMEASGWSGVAASLAAGIVDIPTLIPVGKALQLGRAGASLAENVGKTAVAGAIDASISEAALQATQQTRTNTDAVINIASGAIIGAAIGGAVHAVVGHEVADKVAARMDDYRADAANGFVKGKAEVEALDAEYAAANKATLDNAPSKGGSSAGAAFADVAARENTYGKNTDDKVSAMMFDKLPSITTAPTEFMAKYLGNKTLLGRPRDAIRASELDTARQFGRMFYSSPEISEANALGRPNFKGMTVEDHIGEDLGKLSEFKAEVNNIYAANAARFPGGANELAEKAYYAALNEGIDTVGKDPAVEAVARAFNKYADYQHAKHVANGRLPENTPTMGTPGGYVRRVYNQAALRANEDQAKEMLYKWAYKSLVDEAEKLDLETGYSEKLAKYEASVASYEARVASRKEFPKILAAWKERKAIAAAQDRADYEGAMRDWRDKVATWASDPANDGKKHPFGLQKPKVSAFTRDFESIEPRPRQTPEETITDGNPKPATPKKNGRSFTVADAKAEARGLAEDVFNTLAGVRSQIPRGADGRVSVRTGYLKGRVVDIPDSVLAENFYLQTNLLEHAERMHYTSGRDAALGSVFKTMNDHGELVGDYDGNSILLAIEEEADAVILDTTGPTKDRLIAERDRMLQGIKNEIGIARGNFDSGTGLIGPEAAHKLASVSYAVRLGGVTVSSLTDAPKIAISQGLGNTFRHGILPLFKDFRETMRVGGKLRDQAVRVGNVVEVLHNTRMADVFELNNPHAVGDKWSSFIDKATQKATQISLISHWTDFVKQIAHNTTSSRMLSYADMGWERLSQRNRTWLANLGLDEADMAKVKAEYAAQDTKQYAGVLYADLDKWSDQDLAARFAAAFRREGRSTVVSPGLGDRPQFMHTPEGKLMYQFQTFMLTDQIRFVARQAQLANVGGDAAEKMRQRLAFGAGLSSLVMAAVFVDSLKRAMRENDADWDAFVKRWQDNPGGSMYDAIDRAGFMGSLFGASNTVGKFTPQFSIRGGAQWLAGDKQKSDARKVRDVDKFGVLLGPSAGIASDLINSAQAGAKVLGGGDISRQDLRRFQNTLPFHAVPGIQQGLNAVNELSAGALGLPPEAQR